ncbi:MAG TPA: hypothetical protein VE093_14110 [Polyangiaceae bacterium]|nr:hypothetical protein [Polyangiaceae bacterium]
MLFRPSALGPVLAIILCTAGGCSIEPSRDTPPPPPTQASASLPTETPEEPGEQQEKQRRFQDASVYVDGKPIAVVMYLELPARLPIRWKTLEDGRKVRRFQIAEYLETLGVELASIKQLHIYGPRGRISIVSGEELRRVRGSLLFSFTQGDRGKPRMHFPSDGMQVNTQIDIVQNIAVYVHKQPPKYDGKYHTLSLDDGQPIKGIPYMVGERPGGTRVYVDGALRTSVKRKFLPGRIVVPGSPEAGTSRFIVRSYLESIGIDPASIQTVELLGPSEVITRLTGPELAAMPELVFTLPRRSRGLIQVELPGNPAKVEAISVYIKSSPPDRAAREIPPE